MVLEVAVVVLGAQGEITQVVDLIRLFTEVDMAVLLGFRRGIVSCSRLLFLRWVQRVIFPRIVGGTESVTLLYLTVGAIRCMRVSGGLFIVIAGVFRESQPRSRTCFCGCLSRSTTGSRHCRLDSQAELR